jgi:hydrogenase maturation protease
MTGPGGRTDQSGRAPILVLGVGNELFTDEGLGCVAARRIADLAIPGVDVLDGATLGLALLPEISERSALLLLDAVVADGAAPGDLLEFHGDEVPARYRLTVSVHQIGVEEALAAAEFAGRRPPVLAALGLVPADLGVGVGLSPLAGSGLNALVDRALVILETWGCRVPTTQARAAQTPR